MGCCGSRQNDPSGNGPETEEFNGAAPGGAAAGAAAAAGGVAAAKKGGGKGASTTGRGSQYEDKYLKYDPSKDKYGLHPATTRLLRKEFAKFDEDKSGGIDKKELRTLMRGRGIMLSDSAYKELLGKYGIKNKYGDRQIKENEFLMMMAPYMRTAPSEELPDALLTELKKKFSRVDADGSGSIEEAELKALLLASGKQVNDAQVKALLRKYDVDRNGVLTFDEFVEMTLCP